MSRLRQVLLTLCMLALAHPFLVVAVVAAPLAAAVWDGWAFLAPPLAWVVFGALGALLARPELPGAPILPADEPELAALVSRTAERLGFQAPLAIRVVPVVDASLLATKLRGTPAYALLLGWPLVRHLDEAELTAVIAHELAHRTHFDDRWTLRMLSAREGLIASAGNLVHAPAFLARPLLAATQPTAWALELGADQDAVQITGVAAAQQALLHTDRLIEAYESLPVTWEDVLRERDQYPVDVFAAMADALQDPVFVARLDATNARPFPVDVSDSHPPVAERLAALGELPASDPERRPIRLRTADTLERRCVEMLYDTDLTAVHVLELDPDELAAPVDELVSLLLTATSEHDVPSALRAGVAALADGTWADLAGRLEVGLRDAAPSQRHEAARMIVSSCVAQVLVEGLRASGWERTSRWTRVALRSPDGSEVRVLELVQQALDSGDVSQVEPLVAAASFAGTPS